MVSMEGCGKQHKLSDFIPYTKSNLSVFSKAVIFHFLNRFFKLPVDWTQH